MVSKTSKKTYVLQVYPEKKNTKKKPKNYIADEKINLIKNQNILNPSKSSHHVTSTIYSSFFPATAITYSISWSRKAYDGYQRQRWTQVDGSQQMTQQMTQSVKPFILYLCIPFGNFELILSPRVETAKNKETAKESS